jgi:hypothetical protein
MFAGMSRTINPATLPQHDRPAADPLPYSPEWLNALNDAQRQSPEIKKISRLMHDIGALADMSSTFGDGEVLVSFLLGALLCGSQIGRWEKSSPAPMRSRRLS